MPGVGQHGAVLRALVMPEPQHHAQDGDRHAEVAALRRGPRDAVTVTKRAPRSAAARAGITAQPSMRASSARSGSTSHTITAAPAPRARWAMPLPAAP